MTGVAAVAAGWREKLKPPKPVVVGAAEGVFAGELKLNPDWPTPNEKAGTAAGAFSAGFGGATAPGLTVSHEGQTITSGALRRKQPLHSQDPSFGLNISARDLDAADGALLLASVGLGSVLVGVLL